MHVNKGEELLKAGGVTLFISFCCKGEPLSCSLGAACRRIMIGRALNELRANRTLYPGGTDLLGSGRGVQVQEMLMEEAGADVTLATFYSCHNLKLQVI